MTNNDVTILLIEDDEVDVRAVKRSLKQQKIINPIVVASDGLEALELLRGSNGKASLPEPYLILLDLNMPRMNGIEFLHEVREDPALHHNIIFVLTTSNADEDRVAAYEHHVAGYVLKSNTGQDFLRVGQLVEQFFLSVRFPTSSSRNYA